MDIDTAPPRDMAVHTTRKIETPPRYAIRSPISYCGASDWCCLLNDFGIDPVAFRKKHLEKLERAYSELRGKLT